MHYTEMQWYSLFAFGVGVGVTLVVEHLLLAKVKGVVAKFRSMFRF